MHSAADKYGQQVYKATNLQLCYTALDIFLSKRFILHVNIWMDTINTKEIVDGWVNVDLLSFHILIAVFMIIECKCTESSIKDILFENSFSLTYVVCYGCSNNSDTVIVTFPNITLSKLFIKLYHISNELFNQVSIKL